MAIVLALAAPAASAPTATKLSSQSAINAAVVKYLGKLKIATGNTTRGVNGKTITIEGIASATENGSSIFPGVCDGAAAAFAASNKAGGVNGYKINYIGCHDDAFVAATANQLAAAAVEQNHVFAIVPYSSGIGSTVLLNKEHVPYFGFGFDQSGYCGWNNLQFGFSSTSAESCVSAIAGNTIYSSYAISSYLAATKLSPSKVKLALLGAQLPDSESANNAFALIAQKLGVKVVYHQNPVPGPTAPQLTDYSPIAHQIVSSGANFIINDAEGASTLGIASALRTAGYTGAQVQYTFSDATFLGVPAVAQAVDGLYAGSAQVGTSAFPSAQTRQVTADMKLIGSNAPINQGTLSSFGSAELFLAALKKVTGPLTTEKLAAVLNKGFTYSGFGNAVCGSTWPAARVAASSCGAMFKLDGKTASLTPVLNTGNYGDDYLLKGLANSI
jgi:branched-chain amino acid transport system substrate-binding protein